MKLRNKIILIIVCAFMAILLGGNKANAEVTSDGVWEYSIVDDWEDNTCWPVAVNKYTYKEKVIMITGCNDRTSKELSIPNEIDGIPVAYIKDFETDADYACKILNIPSNIRPYQDANEIEFYMYSIFFNKFLYKFYCFFQHR